MNPSMKFALRIWAYYLVAMLLCIFFILPTGDDAIGIILNVALVGGVLLLVFNEGGYRGEKACTLSATLEKQEREGRGIGPAASKDAFSKANAWRALLIAAAPFVLIAALNVIVDPPDARVPMISELTDEAVGKDDAFQDLNGGAAPAEIAEVPAASFKASDGMRVVSRLFFAPFFFTFRFLNEAAGGALFFAYGFAFPLAGAIGYLQGPKLRERKLKAMLKGKRRKMRNLKVNQPPKRQKAEV